MFEAFSVAVQHDMQVALFRGARKNPQDDERSRAKTAETILKAVRQGITSAEGLTAIARRSQFRRAKN